MKDLILPGNLQEIMNRVLAAERNSQAQLVEARTRAAVEQFQAQSRAEVVRCEAEAESAARRVREQADAEALRVRAEAEARAYGERVKAAEALDLACGANRSCPKHVDYRGVAVRRCRPSDFLPCECDGRHGGLRNRKTRFNSSVGCWEARWGAVR